MNNGVQAALDIGATDLVIVAIQQSLGVIVCKKESLMVQLNRHRELVVRLESVKYLHAVREYNASADSLATEALENKASNVISDESRLAELKSLNRIQEIIYAPITESSAGELNPRRTNPRLALHKHKFRRDICHTWNRHGDLEPSWSGVKKYFGHRGSNGNDQTPCKVEAQTRHICRQNHWTGGQDVTQEEEANGVPTEASVRLEAEFSRVTVPNGDTPVFPDAEDVDPLTVQRERRRRIATAQEEELRWANLKTVIRGEESTLTYRAARDAWKMSDHFVLSEDNVLYYVGTRPLRSDQQQEDVRLVVPSTMIQEVLQNCRDSLEGVHQGIKGSLALSTE
ncbi:hypothetical protein PHMEG_00021701 [Phytophthora megakarya]|uniref:RNase H type-1 domain-containing protein n=1 Tax=Phytophthora megakarya TaxID=4795 RepID=A0A225VMW2_9STRA|nr:hypothetical protein PHMEG_00021701 [Phytophthora megakarya]